MIGTKEKTTAAFARALKKNGTIVDVAKELGQTVSVVSRMVADLAAKSPKLAAVFEEKRWPQNINRGYIFTGKGDIHQNASERAGNILIRGQLVLAEKLPSRNKTHRNKNFEIFLPIIIQEIEVFVERIAEDGKIIHSYNKEEEKLWIEISHPRKWAPVLRSKEDIFRLPRFAEMIKRGVILKIKATGKKKTRYIAGHWLAQVNRNSLVSVNDDWT